jgi:hypothetical protein
MPIYFARQHQMVTPIVQVPDGPDEDWIFDRASRIDLDIDGSTPLIPEFHFLQERGFDALAGHGKQRGV